MSSAGNNYQNTLSIFDPELTKFIMMCWHYLPKTVKQHPYRMNPVKQQILREVQCLLDNDFIEPSQSE